MSLSTKQKAYIENGMKGPLFNRQVEAVVVAVVGVKTYTAIELSRGLIMRDPAGGARTDVTPTAVLLLAADPAAYPGKAFKFTVRNTADAAETITMAGGVGVTTSGTMTIVQNNTKEFMMVVTGPDTCTMYSLGTVVH